LSTDIRKVDSTNTPIGGGSEYVSIFMKQAYNRNMTMEQAAELGYFAIKYIEDFQLMMTVGVSDGIPQIWFMPDNERDVHNEKIDYPVPEAERVETSEILNRIQSNVIKRLTMHRDHLNRLFRT
jgi:hypothetical protein